MNAQEELKKINSDLELLEAELSSNVEELERILQLLNTYKRETYLRLRNTRLEENLKELQGKKKALTDYLDWERRTSLV